MSINALSVDRSTGHADLSRNKNCRCSSRCSACVVSLLFDILRILYSPKTHREQALLTNSTSPIGIRQSLRHTPNKIQVRCACSASHSTSHLMTLGDVKSQKKPRNLRRLLRAAHTARLRYAETTPINYYSSATIKIRPRANHRARALYVTLMESGRRA
jgi:hypothetical protein